MSGMPMEIEIRVVRLGETRAYLLSDSEKTEAQGIPDSARRIRFERTRSALRETLAGRLGVPAMSLEFRRADGGKPFIVNASACEFSISHSGEWLAIAMGDVPVGIDIETRTPGVEVSKLAARFFSPNDAALLNAQLPHERSAHFAKQWVAKEAALKAAGVGISQHLHIAECVLANGEICEVLWVTNGRPERFAIRQFTLIDGTPGAVACAGIPEIRWRDPGLISVC
jgi:4'-phosphopantetheinyl transferase